MGDQIKNMMVGLVMLSACAFTIALILFLKPSVGNAQKTYEVRFSNINGIGIGTRVMFAGKPIGEVTDIQTIPGARNEKADSLNRMYVYQLTLKVDSTITLYSNDVITIQTSGLLGEKSIAIIPEEPAPGAIVRPIKKEVIYAESADALETAFYQMSKVAKSMEGTFSYLHDWLEKNGNSLASAISSFDSVMHEANHTLSSVNQSHIIANIDKSTADFSTVMQQAKQSMQELRETEFFTNIGSIGSNVAQISGSIATAKGTLGKLIEEDDMYMQVTSLLTKADTLMNDINHYGLLFHLNKTWQRQRLQEIARLNTLSTPAAFKNYFEQEVQEVNLSLSRLALLLEKAEQNPKAQEIFDSTQFSKDFAEFLRQVNSLSKSVKQYNEQLVEKQYTRGAQ